MCIHLVYGDTPWGDRNIVLMIDTVGLVSILCIYELNVNMCTAKKTLRISLDTSNSVHLRTQAGYMKLRAKKVAENENTLDMGSEHRSDRSSEIQGRHSIPHSTGKLCTLNRELPTQNPKNWLWVREIRASRWAQAARVEALRQIPADGNPGDP